MKLFVEFDRFGLFAIFCYKFGFFSVFGTTFDGLLWTNELAVIYLWGLMLILLALTGPDIKLWSFFSFDRGSWHIFSLFLSIPILSNLSTVSFDGLSSIYTLMVGASPWLRRALTYSIWIMLSCDLWRPVATPHYLRLSLKRFIRKPRVGCPSQVSSLSITSLASKPP